MNYTEKENDVFPEDHLLNPEKSGFKGYRQSSSISGIDRLREEGRIREAVAIFDKQEDLDAAVADLEITAFPRHDISVLGDRGQIRHHFLADYVEPEKVEDNPLSPRVAPVMPEERTIGAGAICSIFAYIAGCIGAMNADVTSNLSLLISITVGSIVGAVFGFIVVLCIRSFLWRDIRRQIEKGGLVLWVRTPTPAYEDTACSILKKHGGRHIHIHEIQ